MAMPNLEQYNLNAETGEEKIITLSDEESAYYRRKEEEAIARIAAQEQEKASRAERKTLLLNRLGITEEEARLLLS